MRNRALDFFLINLIFQNLKSKWNGCSKRKKTILYVIIYTLIFLLIYAFSYGPFLLQQKTFILHSDGVDQHYPLLVYVGRELRNVFKNALTGNFKISLFDINSGLGDDIIGLLNSLGRTDPLVLFSAFFPVKYSEYFYCFLCIFRLYLSGLSFTYLCMYYNKRTIFTLIGTIIYVYSGYGFSSAIRHPYFVNPMIILPLLIIGADKIIRKKGKITFIFALAYAVICGFYHLYMMSIMICVFCLIRFFDLYRTNRLKEFIYILSQGVIACLLGIGISAPIFFPSIFEFFYGSRAGFSNYNPPEYNSTYFINRFLRMFAPTPNATGLVYPSFAALAFFSIVLLLLKKEKRTLKWMTIIAFLFFWVDLGNLIMNGFQYSSQRWTFGLALVVAFVVVDMLPELIQLTSSQKILCVLLTIFYLILFFSSSQTRKLTYISIGAIFVVLTLTLLTISFTCDKCSLKNDKRDVKTEQYFRACACVLLVILNVAIDNFYKVVPDQGNLVSGYANMGKTVSNLMNSIERELEPYLLKEKIGRADSSLFRKNTSIVWRIPGMLTYSSVANKNITEFWNKMECVGSYSAFNFFSTDQRTIVNTLLSEKYHIESEKTLSYVPYGYENIEKTKKDNYIFENKFSLPWGYTYDKSFSYDYLESLDPISKQEAMLHGIALNSEKNVGSIAFENKKLSYQIEFVDCIWENGLLKVQKPNAQITLRFNAPYNSENYIRLLNLRSDTEFDLKVFNTKVSKFSRVLPPSGSYYFERENYTFNLGYNQEQIENSEVNISFPVKGTYELSAIDLYSLPMEDYADSVELLRNEALENIKWETNKISGTINLSKDKILCMSVPYSKGWSARVDGKKAEILRGNYMFMALPLSAGYHQVEFSYCSPGLKIGLIICLFSIVTMFWLIVQEYKRKGCNK